MAVFGNCSNLAFIGMRDAVGDESFLELPQSLTTIGKYAFSFSGSSPIYLILHMHPIDQPYCFQISALTKMQMKRKKLQWPAMQTYPMV